MEEEPFIFARPTCGPLRARIFRNLLPSNQYVVESHHHQDSLEPTSWSRPESLGRGDQCFVSAPRCEGCVVPQLSGRQDTMVDWIFCQFMAITHRGTFVNDGVS